MGDVGESNRRLELGGRSKGSSGGFSSGFGGRQVITAMTTWRWREKKATCARNNDGPIQSRNQLAALSSTVRRPFSINTPVPAFIHLPSSDLNLDTTGGVCGLVVQVEHSLCGGP